MRIAVSPFAENPKPLFQACDIKTIRLDLNLTDRTTLKLNKHIRSAAGPKAVQTGMKKEMTENNHRLDSFFRIKLIDFVKIDKGVIVEKTPRYAVLCSDVDSFIDYLKSGRDYDDNDNVLVKIGIDGGGGFLKVCLNIFQLDRSPEHAQYFKDTSVKRIFIIAIAPLVQENYHNLQKLWISLNLHKIKSDFVIATDLKLCNILIGIMPHGSTYPCCWCTAPSSDMISQGSERTVKSLKNDFWKWQDEGGIKSKAKLHHNTVHPSLVSHGRDKDTKVIEVIPPPELHLLTGPVSTIYKAMTAEWKDSDKWLKASNIQQDGLHGGTFTGNSARALLNKVDVLRSLCPLEILKYAKAFNAFQKVSCDIFLKIRCTGSRPTCRICTSAY